MIIKCRVFRICRPLHQQLLSLEGRRQHKCFNVETQNQSTLSEKHKHSRENCKKSLNHKIIFNTETLECHLKSELAGSSQTAGVESGDIVSSPCSCVRGRRSHLSLLGPETHCCCRSPSTSSWYLKHKHSHRWRQHCYYKLSGCVRPTGCGASSHLQGAARPVSAGCFCEMEGSFRSWRGLPETIPGGGTLPILRYKSSVSRFWLACRSCTSARCLFSDQFVICSQIRMWPVLSCRLVILISVSAALTLSSKEITWRLLSVIK